MKDVLSKSAAGRGGAGQERSLNIALLGRDFLWGGGADFLRNLANALVSVADERRLRLFLLLPVKNRVDSLGDLRTNVLKTTGALLRRRKWSPHWPEPVFDESFRDCFRNVDGRLEPVEYNDETGLVRALGRIRADVVLPAAIPPGPSFPFPWVGYIYDFQHRYYPDYFTARESLDRDIHFATMLRDAKAVIVNARTAKHDIERFFPKRECEVFDLPFSAAPVSTWLEEEDPGLLDRYKLPGRFFLISNQFWIHKSHLTAFRALAKLSGEPGGADLHIVCTGKMEDHRFPEHVEDLKREIKTLGIADRVHLLGHIPKRDQIAIMKRALAVLQPTLFEGGPGGGAVYDAVSLGVPAILSDIPVNREIEGEENLFFFRASCEGELAQRISELLEKSVSRRSKKDLSSAGRLRKRALGERLLEAVRHVMRNRT